MSPDIFLKRAIDILACLLILPLALPLSLVLMLLIRLESRGWPLFVQDRVGRNGVPFRMLKLRTMRPGTAHVPSHEVGHDRITRVGRILRQWQLDELPQVANVLLGSMSLVGPRPCLPTQTELIEARRARDLFRLRPGVTGPAQLEGVDMSEPVRLAEVEAAYFRHSTVWRDLRLMAQTVVKMLRGGGGDAALRLRDR